LAEYSDFPNPLQAYATQNERPPSKVACSLSPICSYRQLSNILGERKSKVARKLNKKIYLSAKMYSKSMNNLKLSDERLEPQKVQENSLKSSLKRKTTPK
jgi:hypothetical protein